MSPSRRHSRESTYAAKLRDPRWQKRRLTIMERDDWTCQSCGIGDATLHVHHRWYVGDPWEAPDDALVTLCEPCHEAESVGRREDERSIIHDLRRIVLASGVNEVATAVHSLVGMDIGPEVIEAACWLIENKPGSLLAERHRENQE